METYEPLFFGINVTLNIMVVIVHVLAIITLLKCLNNYQIYNNHGYTLAGWLKIFDKHGKDLGVYLIRLIFSAGSIMMVMNFWHLFTFASEGTPSIKNIGWRLGNLLVAIVFLVIATEFSYYSDKDHKG